MAQTTLTFDVQKRKRQRTKFLSGAVYYVGVTALALLMLYPVAWLVASALKGPDEVWLNVSSVIPPALRWCN